MANSFTAHISNSEIAANRAFIYFIFVKEIKALYVGQTFSAYGALGRLSQHLSESNSNTLKQRIKAIYGYESIDFEEIYFTAAALSNRKSFQQRGADYREAVEALISNRVINFVSGKKIGIVVSRVQFNSYTKLKYIQAEANSISIFFENWISSLVDS